VLAEVHELRDGLASQHQLLVDFFDDFGERQIQVLQHAQDSATKETRDIIATQQQQQRQQQQQVLLELQQLHQQQSQYLASTSTAAVAASASATQPPSQAGDATTATTAMPAAATASAVHAAIMPTQYAIESLRMESTQSQTQMSMDFMTVKQDIQSLLLLARTQAQAAASAVATAASSSSSSSSSSMAAGGGHARFESALAASSQSMTHTVTHLFDSLRAEIGQHHTSASSDLRQVRQIVQSLSETTMQLPVDVRQIRHQLDAQARCAGSCVCV
jgi:hypothetical protein